jgi:hypothetical protein
MLNIFWYKIKDNFLILCSLFMKEVCKVIPNQLEFCQLLFVYFFLFLKMSIHSIFSVNKCFSYMTSPRKLFSINCQIPYSNHSTGDIPRGCHILYCSKGNCDNTACCINLGKWLYSSSLTFFYCCSYYYYLIILAFELSSLSLLGRQFTAFTMPQTLFSLVILEIGSCFLPRPAWNAILLSHSFHHSCDDRHALPWLVIG